MRYGKFDENMQSAGGLLTTPIDMARWLQANMNDGRLGGRQVLPAAAVRKAHSTLASVNLTSRGVRQVGYGLGWRVSLAHGDTILVHGGGFNGFSTHMSFMPDIFGSGGVADVTMKDGSATQVTFGASYTRVP